MFHTTMGQSDQLDKFLPAFLAFQKEVENVERTRDNPFFNSRYATLASILDHVMPLLNKNGIAFLQSPSFDPESGAAYVTTVLIHESGQFICGTSGAKTAKTMDGQTFGSTTTYLRRYGLAAILGITQADDDGAAGSGDGQKPHDVGVRATGVTKPNLRTRDGQQPKDEPKDESAALGEKSMSRWPQIRERLMLDGMTDVQAESEVAKLRKQWAEESEKTAGNNRAKKIQGIIDRQDAWAKEASITFNEAK